MILQTTGRKPAGCCDEVVFLDLSKMEWPLQFLQLNDYNLWITSFCVVFNPFFWNVVSDRTSCKMGVQKWWDKQGPWWEETRRSLDGYHDSITGFKLMLESQPKWPMLYENWLLLSGYASIWIGTTLVFSSFYSLGFYGTFLGDYFGILMDKKVTGFPFNILDNPMYVGSTLNFLGAALVKASQTGIFVSMIVAIVYRIALMFEGPFTEHIYSQKKKN
ncbi:phosphatidylethanolamine N-methyltransferase-like isoform X2 [Ylistrum balloti]|uniref:phosphatidylethanolamine N-methyltransferase-like isoform X2 n=1 Tax=Ylistrum balloti TaxID=509963 RepID=UPI002905CE57|nr:phosphatidylethanolamine N-methyltransferase-like isoform X2 [Ylistrum balloti]